MSWPSAPSDGKILWKTEVGTFRQGQQMYYYSYTKDTTPQPRLILQAGAIYVDTHAGVLARLDAESGALDWGYGYRTDAVQGEDRFFYYMPPSDPTTTSAPPARLDDALLVKGAQSDMLEAVDPNRMSVLWERPISKSARVLGTDGRTVYFGGPELSALDLKTRTLTWATKLPARAWRRGSWSAPRGSGSSRRAASSRSTPAPARSGGSSGGPTSAPSAAT